MATGAAAGWRIGFAGTPEFARLALAALIDAGHQVPVVLTQPDRPAGRGLKLQASAVKQHAVAHALPVLQPRSLRLDGKFVDDAQAAQQRLVAADLDVLVVAAYGLILPAWVLGLPRHRCLNIHGSLLPRWRGAAPIQRAIEAGDTHTGITLMQMDAGLDTGDMLLTETTAVDAADTSASLHDRLAGIGARVLLQGLSALAQGVLPRVPQPDAGVSYAHKIDKAEAAIHWQQPAAVIERRLRAFDPFPGATAQLAGQPLKLWRGRVVAGHGVPGERLASEPTRWVVACGDGALEVLEVQAPGGRRLPMGEFLARLPT
jgi:methionyl-tRNA formyltransferase